MIGRYTILISFQKSYKLRILFIIPILVFLLYLLITSILSPYFEIRLMVKEYEFVNLVNSRICHQFPSRCYYIFGSNVGLCARCFSAYLGVLITLIFFSIFYINISLFNRFILGILLCVPLFIDGFTQYYQLRTSTNILRTITGLLAGTGITILIYSWTELISKFYHNLIYTIIRREV